MTAEGYDEAVESGMPFASEHDVLAQNAAEPVALTEAEPISEEAIVLQEPGRDLRPDTITPAPDVTSSGAAAMEHLSELDTREVAEEEFAGAEEFPAEVSAAETNTTSAPESIEDAAEGGSSEKEKQDASPDAAK